MISEEICTERIEIKYYEMEVKLFVTTLNPLQEDMEHILSHTEMWWESLRGERLFITGGTGFFGCWLLESFLWAKERLNLDTTVMVLTRHSQAFQLKAPYLAYHPAIALHSGNIQTFDFPNGTFSHLIHAAMDVTPREDAVASKIIQQPLISGTQRVLDFAQQSGVKKLLLTSSGAVYGQNWNAHKFQEADAETASVEEHPRSLYGAAKYMAEQHCKHVAEHSDIEMKIARCFTFTGPYLPLTEGYAIGNFIRDGLAGSPLQIKGDGTSVRSYLYASDLMIWLWTILFQGTSGRPYNVGSEEAFSIRGVAEQVSEHFNPLPELHVAQSPSSLQVANWYVPQVLRAKTELGLEQTVPFVEALRKSMNWYRENGLYTGI